MTTTTSFHLYMTSPIDAWAETFTLAEWRARLEGAWLPFDVARLLAAAAHAARTLSYWEGDGMDDVRVCVVPNLEGADFLPCFMWKQSNNGSTFILAPFEMPHLGAEFIRIRLDRLAAVKK